MKFFRNLRLRTKLILAFVSLALLVSVIAFTFPQFSLDQLTEESVPFLDITGQVSILAGGMQRELLEYINSGEAESLEEFDEHRENLNNAVAEISEKYATLMDADDFAELEQAAALLDRTGQAIIASHTKTLQNLEQLKVAEQNLERMEESEQILEAIEEDGHTFKADGSRVSLHELSEAASSLQLEAVEYVASGDEETVEEFLEHEAEFQKEREATIAALHALEPEAINFITAFDQMADQVGSVSRAVIDSHSESLEEMETLEALEDELEDVLAKAAVVAAQEIQSSEEEVRISFMVSAVVTMLLAIGFGILVTRGIVKPVDQLSMTAQQIGAGDLSVRAEVNSSDEIGQMAQAFNQMANLLQESFILTEQQSERRIRELEVTADISRQLTTMLDVDQVLQHVVNQIQQSFGYYHVHIYLSDLETGELVMREGSGDVGEQLRARGHRLQPGQGIVGRVADNAQPLLVPNVDEMPEFVRNPLLPKTASELAVPLRKGALVLGVLDMQSEDIEGFSDQDLTLMQTIADQVAVVIDNARLFRQTRAAVAEAETLTRRLTLTDWANVVEKISEDGYVFTKSGVAPLTEKTEQIENEESWLPVMREALQKKEITQWNTENGDSQPGVLSVPLVLRDEVIGVIGIERAVSETADNDEESTGAAVWSEDEITTVRAITEQVTLALEAARLSQETQRAAWRDRVVGESTAKLWATDEIEEVMRAAVTQIGDQLKASEVVIRIGKEDDVPSE